MGSIPLWLFLLRVIILYLAVMVALRIMGKREIGQLSVFDFVVSVMLAELSTLPMENTDMSILQSLVPIGALVILQLLVAMLQIRSHRFRHWVDGEPTVLIEHGDIKESEMKRMRYSVHDLLTQVREKGFANVADVEFAILETSGTLSVFPKPDAAPLTPKVLNIQGTPTVVPMPLVVDGVPVKKTLSILKQDPTWLEEELKRRGWPDINQVFYAAIDERGALLIDGRREEGRREEGRREEGRREEGRQEEGRQEEGRQEEGRREEGRQEEGRQEEGRQEEGRREEGRREEHGGDDRQ